MALEEVLDSADGVMGRPIVRLPHRPASMGAESDGQRSATSEAQPLYATGSRLYHAVALPNSPEDLPATCSSPVLNSRAEDSTSRKRAASARPLEGFFAKLTKTPDQAVKTYTCASCEDNFETDECVRLPCGHFYCHEDLKTFFRVATDSSNLPHCCRQAVTHEDVAGRLDLDLVNEWQNKSHRHMEELGEARKAQEAAAVQHFIKLAKAKGWQMCLSCGQMVERTEGCNHMT